MAKMSPKQYYSSQRDDARGGEKAPPMAHLAVRVNEASIAALAPGTHIYIVRDPAQVDGVFELVFEKVKFKQRTPVELHFKVPSDKPNSTRKCIMTIAWLGDYRSWMKADLERQQRESDEKRTKPDPDCPACGGAGAVDITVDGQRVRPCEQCWKDV